MNKEISHIATSYSGNIFAVAEFEKMVYVWDFDKDLRIQSIESILDFGGRRLAISPNGEICAAGAYNKYGISMYDVGTGKILWNRKDLKRVQILKFNPGGDKIYACFETKPMHIIDCYTGEVCKTLRGKRKIWFSPLDESYILEDNIKIRFYNDVLNTNFEINRETFAILDVTYSEDTVFTSESGGALRAISTIDGEEKWRAYFEDNHFLRIGYNKENNLIYGVLWNFEKGGNSRLYTLESNKGKVLNIIEMEKDTYATGFIKNCSYLICSNGSVYDLSGIKPEIVKKFDFF